MRDKPARQTRFAIPLDVYADVTYLATRYDLRVGSVVEIMLDVARNHLEEVHELCLAACSYLTPEVALEQEEKRRKEASDETGEDS